MRLIMVRHALSVENERRVVTGYRTHGSLSPLGIEQARRTAQRLRNEGIDVIFSSDLRRAARTAEIIAGFHKGVPLILTRQIRERDYGNLEGRPIRDFSEKRESLGMKRHEFRPEGGEDYSDVRKRAGRFYRMLLREYKERSVLIVAHGEFILNLVGLILGESLERTGKRELRNASVSVLETDGKTVKNSLINNTDHLKGCMG